jgi:hypothetical protein
MSYRFSSHKSGWLQNAMRFLIPQRDLNRLTHRRVVAPSRETALDLQNAPSHPPALIADMGGWFVAA